jgi:hypothetical protein
MPRVKVLTPKQCIVEWEKMWKNDNRDLGWFLTVKEYDGMTDKELSAFKKGIKQTLKSLKSCVDDFTFT